MNKQRRRHAGFTLIESALTTVIVGTGVLAIVAAQQAYHQKNDWAQRSGIAVLLANELRELTLTLPSHDTFTPTNMGPETGEGQTVVGGVVQYTFDDVDDFAGVVTAGFGAGTVFDPPINALLQEIDGIEGWSQLIQVDNVLPDNISATATQPLGTTELMRVTVTVRFQGPNDPAPVAITQLTWVISD